MTTTNALGVSPTDDEWLTEPGCLSPALLHANTLLASGLGSGWNSVTWAKSVGQVWKPLYSYL